MINQSMPLETATRSRLLGFRASAAAIAVILLWSCAASAQLADNFHVFPQFADGVLSDGSSYRSTLVIQSLFSTRSVTCNLTLRGMSTSFPSTAVGSSFSITVPANGWAQLRTNGIQAFQSGYATLTCSDFVYAQVLYSLYIGGAKVSEATVFSSSPSFSFKLMADQTENSRLGIAVSNDTDLSRTYQITLVTSTGATYATGSFTVGARQALARFLDEVIPSSRNQILQVQIRASDFSNFSAVGLRFTGTVFTTIPAN